MVDPISASLIAAGLTATLDVGFTTVAVSSIAAYALVGGAVVGGAVLLNALQPKKHSDDQITVKQAVPARVRCYGRALLGGAYFFFASQGVLISGFILCEGPIDAFEEHWFSGQISPDGGANNGFGRADLYPWYELVNFYPQLGTTDQTVNQGISSFIYWDPSHRNCGLANTVMVCHLPGNPSKNFTKYYPSGVPSYLARVRGCKVFDPRVAAQKQGDPTTWAWSANPALCIMDYMTSSRGMNIPPARMNLAAFVAMADVCDEPVALGALGVTGDDYGQGTMAEARYVLWGTYTLDEEPKAVLERMLKTCDGELYPIADGTIGLRGGAWTPPTVTIDDTMILSIDARRGIDKLAAFNQLKIRTLSVYNQFQVVEGDPWDDVAAQQASGEVLPQDFELVMVPSYTQGCRLAKIAMAKGNPAWIVTVTTSLEGLQALGERTAHLTNADLGIDEDMAITGFEIVDESTCKIGMGSLSALAYEWSIAEEGNPAPSAGMTSTLPYTPPAPTGLVVGLQRTQVNSSTAAVALQASVTPPTDTSLGLSAQYRVSAQPATASSAAVAAGPWIDMTVDDAAYTATSGIVADATPYDVQVALESFGGTIGPYATASIDAVSDPNPPAPVTAFRASANGSAVTLFWTAGDSANYAGVRIYRNTQEDFASATLVGSTYGAPSAAASTTDQPPAGATYSYYIAAFNGSGVASDPVGPYDVTV